MRGWGDYIALPLRRGAGFASCLPGVAELGSWSAPGLAQNSEQVDRWARYSGTIVDFGL